MPGVGCKTCRRTSAGRYGLKAQGKCVYVKIICNETFQGGWPRALFVISTADLTYKTGAHRRCCAVVFFSKSLHYSAKQVHAKARGLTAPASSVARSVLTLWLAHHAQVGHNRRVCQSTVPHSCFRPGQARAGHSTLADTSIVRSVCR